MKWSKRLSRRILLMTLISAQALALTGCAGMIAAEELALVGRGGVGRGTALGMRASLGGELVAVTRVTQASLGSIIAADAQLTRLASKSVRLQVGEGESALLGRAFTKPGGVQVQIGGVSDMLVSTPAPRTGMTGLISEHYVGGRLLSFSVILLMAFA